MNVRPVMRPRPRTLPRAAASALALGLLAGSAAAESDRAYCERQEGIAKTVCLRELDRAAAQPAAPVPAAAAESDRAYCERQEGIAKTVCLRELDRAAAQPAATAAPAAPAAPAAATAAAPAAADSPAPYKVVDGFHVDAGTYKGFQTWRAAACDRCHGANQQGLVGPSLVNSLKTLSKADFVTTVTHGRLEKGMPSFGANPTVAANLDALYAYLKGRSDGAITQAHVVPIQ